MIIIFDEKIEWSKIEFSKQVTHVRMNSFKHFSGAKKGPPRTRFSISSHEMAVEVFEVLSVVMTSSPEVVRIKKFSLVF